MLGTSFLSDLNKMVTTMFCYPRNLWCNLKAYQQLVAVSLLLFLIYHLCKCLIYNLFFHPLSRIPGPWIYATSRVPYTWQVLHGRLANTLLQLHERYGPIVRTAPNEVSFIQPEAWNTIYGTENSSRCEFPKNYDNWHERVNKFTSMLFLANKDDHRRMRKVLSPAFSDRVIQQNEHRVQVHITKFLNCIGTASDDFTAAVDFNDWFNWLAFDVVSDFALGESFNTLSDPRHRPWLNGLSKSWQFISIISSIKSLGRLKDSFALILPRRFLQKYVDQLTLVGRTALAKLNIPVGQPTFLSIVRATRREREPGFTKKTSLSDDEAVGNTEMIVAAGTETIATVLPAIIELLARNPEKMARVLEEIRSFSTESEINSLSILLQVPYLTACMMETMRIFIPIPEGLPRLCPDVGEQICGYWIPGSTFCQVSAHAANRSSLNFSNPNEFVPERWLKHGHPFANSDYSNDTKAAFQPFSVGPRDCIGQRFALNTIRLVIARLLYRFDVERATQDDWLDQKSYLLWKRRPLMFMLKWADSTS